MTIAALKYNYDDYRLLPENGKRCQLVDGDFFMSPSPTSRHQKISRNVYLPLARFVDERRLGDILYAPLDVILSDTDVVQPDILFISAAHRDRIVSEGVRGAPDLVIEILSPSSREMDLGIKRKLYARHGVSEYWVVDPDALTISIHRLADDPEKPFRIFRSGQSLQSPIFPGLAIPLDDVFRT